MVANNKRSAEAPAVLLVEDDPDDARLANEMLLEAQLGDWELLHVDRLAEACQCLLKPQIECMLLDLRLPDADGLEGLNQVRAIAPDLPIVVLSGYEDEDLAVRAVQEGAQDYLVKGHVNAHLIKRSIRYAIERKRVEQYFAAQYGVSRALAESASLQDAIPKVLHTLGEITGWELGLLWDVDEHGDVLRCDEIWHAPSISTAEFESLTRDTAPSPGVGLPGLAWETAEPTCATDVLRVERSPRARAAAKQGLNGAICVPIVGAGEVLGVIEFFGRELRGADKNLTAMLATVGNQIGQFAEGKRVERELARLKFRFAASEMPLELATCDLDGISSESVEAAKPLAEEKGISLALTGERVPACIGDRDRLAQVFENLISNALHFTPEGGRVEIKLSARDDWAIIQFEDTGIGISTRKQASLFDEFFRAAAMTDEDASAGGVGLTIVKAIVDAHGGRIDVRSEPGRGTTFRVELPLRQHDQSSSDAGPVVTAAR